jgi:predicted GIY-YIG superfamily endonuclease
MADNEEEHDFVYNVFYIYVLECEDNRYYIGKTSNPSFRIEQHKNGVGAVWTQKYKPIKVIETIETTDALDEDKITKKYMMKYGIEFVRGGSYTKIELDDWMIKSLEHEFLSAKDICYKCKEKGHFAKECSLNNQFNIDKYLQDFNTMTDIDMEISKLDLVYETIIILNKQINDTRINGYNMDEYNKLKKNMDKITILNERCRLLKQKNGTTTRGRHLQTPEIIEIELAIQELENVNRNQNNNTLINSFHSEQSKVTTYKYQINQIYQTYFSNNKIYMESHDNTDIKFYKINIFNLQQKKELKKLLEQVTSEDLLKQKLSGLYEKKISILTIDYK